MGWMAARAEQRAEPAALWPEARSVIALGVSYAPEGDPLATLGRADRGNISVYARNRDYHDVVKGMLKQLGGWLVGRFGPEIKVFVDTAPVMEKPVAQAAGLGWQGKHTNLVSRQFGSWLFLGEIMTTLALEPDAAGGGSMRVVLEVPGRVPDRRISGAVSVGCDAVHLIPNDRACGTDPGGVAARDGQPDLRLRRLPGGLSVEPVRGGGTREAAGARSAGGAAAGGAGRVGRCRVPDDVRGRAGEADRAQPVRTQRVDRDREFRRLDVAAGGGAVVRGCGSGGGGCGELGIGAPVSLHKRSFSLAGHRTSVALEPEFWDALADIAAIRGTILSALVAELDAERMPDQPLASRLRIFALCHRP